MTRIHDVLKKSEQGSSTHGGNGLEAELSVNDAAPIAATLTTDIDSRRDLGREARILLQSPSMTWLPSTKTMLFFGSEEPTPGQEQFRTLRTRLYQLREKIRLSTILITSSLPKEGKSFTAANLAQVMACQKGCRALLIDADLRSPSLHLALGTTAAPGLSEYLLNETEEFAIIQKGQMENLFFIPSGRPVSGQTELVSNGRFKLLLNRLGPLFDWIVIDSPAALPVSDSGLVANFCDGVLLVVRSNSTPFDVVRKARERFREDHLLGVVLNGIPAESHLENHYYSETPDASSPPPDKKESGADHYPGERSAKTLLQSVAAATGIEFLLQAGLPRLVRWSRR